MPDSSVMVQSGESQDRFCPTVYCEILAAVVQSEILVGVPDFRQMASLYVTRLIKRCVQNKTLSKFAENYANRIKCFEIVGSQT